MCECHDYLTVSLNSLLGKNEKFFLGSVEFKVNFGSEQILNLLLHELNQVARFWLFSRIVVKMNFVRSTLEASILFMSQSSSFLRTSIKLWGISC